MPKTNSSRPLTIAIDGPAAAGKSSVARAVAARLGLTYVDTGAMYRALTLKALESGVDPEDGPALARMAGGTEMRFEPGGPAEGQRLWLDDCEVTREIRTRPVDQSVSAVSRHPEVREVFRELQRKMVGSLGAVVEGRDIGTVVLPRADLKVYLDARLEERVERRYAELRRKGYPAEREQVRQDMAERDRLDSSRATAPLAVAPDALRIDTTGRSLDEVIDEVVRLCRDHGGRHE